MVRFGLGNFPSLIKRLRVVVASRMDATPLEYRWRPLHINVRVRAPLAPGRRCRNDAAHIRIRPAVVTSITLARSFTGLFLATHKGIAPVAA